jgi:hypothetical protein
MPSSCLSHLAASHVGIMDLILDYCRVSGAVKLASTSKEFRQLILGADGMSLFWVNNVFRRYPEMFSFTAETWNMTRDIKARCASLKLAAIYIRQFRDGLRTDASSLLYDHGLNDFHRNAIISCTKNAEIAAVAGLVGRKRVFVIRGSTDSFDDLLDETAVVESVCEAVARAGATLAGVFLVDFPPIGQIGGDAIVIVLPRALRDLSVDLNGPLNYQLLFIHKHGMLTEVQARRVKALIPWSSSGLFVTQTFARIPKFSQILSWNPQRENCIQSRFFQEIELHDFDLSRHMLLCYIALGGTCYTQIACVSLS